MPNFGDTRLPDRFWSKCIPEPMSGCWLWLGKLDRDGYGDFVHMKRDSRAHRVSYEVLVAPINAGLVIDHKCRVTCCVNPAHLEPVSCRVNTRRGINGDLTTHCPQGHAYDERNTYTYADRNGHSHRCCRACNRIAQARRAA